MNPSTDGEADLVEQVTDSFVAALRAGERPNIDVYLKQYPHLAAELSEILPAIALLEQHAAIGDWLDSGRQSPALPREHEIGEFTIVREVGRGGMGVVYEAVQKSLGRHVALKVLSMPTLLNAKHLERFRFEARAAARLQHRNIVPVFGVGEFNGLHYYAMQFIHGKSLHEVLQELRQLGHTTPDGKQDGSIGDNVKVLADGLLANRSQSSAGQPESNHPPAALPKTREFYRNVATIGLQASEALAYAHSEGVLHRDIKPSNLLLDAKGNTWVTDFGLAKTEGTEDLTETGDFVGTLRYMAPERLEGVLDRRSDIYSLGATLYEMVSLHTFFEANSQARLVDQILHHAPLAPSRFERSIPRDLETIILKATTKEPASRYRNAEEMAEELRRFLADKPILSRRPTAREQFVRWCRRNPLVATLSGTVVALLLAAVFILTRSNARIRSESLVKDKALASARNTVHQLLARVGSDKLANIPMSHPLRVGLLEDAVKAYDGLLALSDEDVAVRQQMADVLHSIAGIQRELERHAEAEAALKRSAEIYESLIATDPEPPTIRETLGKVQMDLAYTWQFDVHSSDFKKFPIESQYRRALDTFDLVERDFPSRRQPVTLCLRSLADFADRRGDHAEAERLWQQSIARGEIYMQQTPTNSQAESDLCWACVEYYEAVFASSTKRTSETNALLDKGVTHAEHMLKAHPESVQAADALAALHFRQALVYCRAEKVDQAIPLFRQAITEIETICESVPWNTDYWNSAQWFHEESIRQLNSAHRKEEIDSLAKESSAWLRRVSEKAGSEPIPRQKLQQTQTALVKALRSAGHDQSAEQLINPPK